MKYIIITKGTEATIKVSTVIARYNSVTIHVGVDIVWRVWNKYCLEFGVNTVWQRKDKFIF